MYVYVPTHVVLVFALAWYNYPMKGRTVQ